MDGKFIKQLLIISILTSILTFSGCDNSKEKNRDDNQSSSETVSKNLKGFIQKGPFIQGSEIKVQELDSSLVPKGTTFLTETENDFGGFTLDKGFSSPFLEVTAFGFYFDEVKGKLSEAGIRFKVLSKPSENKPVNINILTTLERERIKHLINEQNKSFEDARVQAEREILNIFHIPDQIDSSFQEMDIAKNGDANAILLAISAVLQGNNGVAELSEMISKISQDIKTDGTLDNGAFVNAITESNINLNLSQIRDNLFKRYESLGLTIDVPKFEDYVDSDGDTVINKYDFAINFTPVENAELKTDYTSEEVTIVLPPSVQSAEATVDNGTIVVNGTEADDHATVKAGDKVSVKLTASLDYNSEVSSTLSVSYPENQLNAGIFSVTTRGDEYFTLANETVTDADLNIEYTSKEQLIVLPESIKNATAAIDNGTLVVNGTESGTSAEVKNGDKIAITITSSSNLNEAVKSELTVSYEGNHNLSCEFSVTTRVQGYIGLENEILQLVEADKFYTTKEREVNFPANISQATIKIEKGVILVNGEEKGKETKLVSGDKFQIKLHSGDEYHYLKPAKTEITITYMDVEESVLFLLNRKEAFTRFCIKGDSSCFVDRNQNLYCWGKNETAIGYIAGSFTDTPILVGEPGSWDSVSCSEQNICAIKKDGTLYCWGEIPYRTIEEAKDKSENYQYKMSPEKLSETGEWQSISQSGGHICGIKTNGTLWCWERWKHDNSESSPTFTQVGNDNNWKFVSCEDQGQWAVKNDNSIYFWGAFNSLEIDGITHDYLEIESPTQLFKDINFESISINIGRIIGLKKDGSIYYPYDDFQWLKDGHYRLLKGSSSGAVNGMISFEGSLFMGGDNSFGQIGNGVSPDWNNTVTTPFNIMESEKFSTLGTGSSHTCALTENGDVYCWGNNEYGQIDATKIEEQPRVKTPKLMLSGSKLFFKEVQNADLNKTYTSNEEWITGSGTVSIDNGTLIINGEEQGQSAEVKENDKISIKLTSSDEHGETISSKVTLKTENGETLETTFSITTRVEPYFTIKNEVIHHAMPETDYTSTPVTVTLPDSIPTAHISIDNGVILVNDQESGKEADVKNGDIVAVKLNTGDTTAYYRHKSSKITVTYNSVSQKAKFFLHNDSAYGKLSSNNYHSCFINTSGALYCWGSNNDGQLGTGTTEAENPYPTRVGNDNDWERVATGVNHTCGIKTNGTLYCWGSNNAGQLGNGTNEPHYQPEKVGNDSNWRDMALGSSNTCAIKTDGSTYCWGNNYLVETEYNKSPERVGTDNDWTQISSGTSHFCAIKSNGSIYCWGYGGHGQFGTGSNEHGVEIPTLAVSENRWKYLSSANYHSCAINSHDNLFCTGENLGGALGTGDYEKSNRYLKVDTAKNPIIVETGFNRISAMIDIDEKMHYWGNTKFVDETDGTTPNRPIPFEENRRASLITIGYYHGCFITAEGELYCWGKNDYGQIGDGTQEEREVPVKIASVKHLGFNSVTNADLKSIHTSSEEVVILPEGINTATAAIDNGTLLVNGEDRGQNAEVSDGDKVAITLTTGEQHGETASSKLTISYGAGNTEEATFSITTRSEPYFDIKDEVINKTIAEKDYTSTPVTVVLPESIPNAKIAVDYGIVLVNDQESGQEVNVKDGDTVSIKLNSGSEKRYYHPAVSNIEVSYLSAVNRSRVILSRKDLKYKVATGRENTCIISSDGKLLCWGSGYNAGDEEDYESYTRIKNNEDTSWNKVSTSYYKTCAIDEDSALYCWSQYQLGTARVYLPPRIGQDNDWMEVSVGNSHICALKSDGSTYCWGENNEGEIGDGTKVKRENPVPVASGINMVSISTGNNFSNGISQDGTVYHWGNGSGKFYHEWGQSVLYPALVEKAGKRHSIAGGYFHSCGIDFENSIQCTGGNGNGQLGSGGSNEKVEGKWLSVDAHHLDSSGIDMNFGLFMWGSNDSGQIGNGGYDDRNIPTAVAAEKKFSISSNGQSHSCAVSTSGELYCWGSNNYGQIGNGTNIESATPQFVRYLFAPHFDPVTFSEPGSEHISNEVEIVTPEKDGSVDVTVENGFLIVNGVESGSSATVNDGDMLKIKATSSLVEESLSISNVNLKYSENRSQIVKFSIRTRINP